MDDSWELLRLSNRALQDRIVARHQALFVERQSICLPGFTAEHAGAMLRRLQGRARSFHMSPYHDYCVVELPGGLALLAASLCAIHSATCSLFNVAFSPSVTANGVPAKRVASIAEARGGRQSKRLVGAVRGSEGDDSRYAAITRTRRPIRTEVRRAGSASSWMPLWMRDGPGLDAARS
jgi:hypothetical protein